jgi:hypothetical protein
MEKWITILTVAIAVLGAVFGIVKYFDDKKQEFKKRIWEERKLIYYEIIDYTSKIAISNNINKINKEIEGFWSMYYGRLSILEDASVYFAMIKYGDELKKVENKDLIPFDSNLRNLSFGLAVACRVSLQNTWEPVELEDLGKLDETQKK